MHKYIPGRKTVAVAVASALLGFSVASVGGNTERPAQRAVVATVSVSPSSEQDGPREEIAESSEDDEEGSRPEDLIVTGAGLTWLVMNECVLGHEPCEAALKEANANPFGVVFMEDGSAITRARMDELERLIDAR